MQRTPAGIPAGMRPRGAAYSGGVAALDLRLIEGKPPACMPHEPCGCEPRGPTDSHAV